MKHTTHLSLMVSENMNFWDKDEFNREKQKILLPLSLSVKLLNTILS